MLEGRTRVIGVNTNQSPMRQRFSLAHEIGHYCLGHRPTLDVHFTESFGAPSTIFERQANAFGAELLMPGAMVRRAHAQSGEDLPMLARMFLVSQQAMWIRLIELGLVTQPTVVAF